MARARTFWVNDYETIVNCFVGVFKNYVTGEYRVFVVHFLQNDWQAFLDFLQENQRSGDWHFGYNNLGFDSQITELILQNMKQMRSLSDPDEITRGLFDYAGSVIGKSNSGEFLDYPEFKLKIPVVDIFKLNHWDNPAKRSSLKWIQYSMDWHNVEEMPHDFRQPVMDRKTLNTVIAYCINDVDSTEAIFKLEDRKGKLIMQDQINMRTELSRTFDLKLYSASETRISKEIFLHFLSDKLAKPKWEIKNQRTERSIVEVKDIILPSVEFKTPEFQAAHNWFKSLVINTSSINLESERTTGPKYRMLYKGCPTDYALGGIHGCVASGIYESKNGRIIKSADVTSFYPMLAIKNGWSPAHLPAGEFIELYQGFFDERSKYPKGHPLNYTFKIVLNATYGLSKNKHSFLYDPEFTFRITINGQLLLSMLYEMLATRIPGLVPLMQNTDGLEVMIDERYEKLYDEICQQWCEMTKLQLEFVDYKKMIIGDVNNYIAVYTDGKTKCKGRFEYEDLALHKNKSFLVIPKALYEYFVHGTDPQDYIETNRNFFDYCAGAKLKGDWFFQERGVNNGEYYEKQHKKLIRYYISERGSKLVKCHPDGREIQLESGRWMQTIANQYVEKDFDEYGIDFKYYLDAIYDEIRKIESGSKVLAVSKESQLSLF